MPYTDTWNEAQPDGATTLRTDVDTVIQQQVKRALRQRLEQALPGFGDDTVDPKVAVPHWNAKIPWALGAPGSATYVYTQAGAAGGFALHPNAISTTLTWIVPLWLPVGLTLSGIDARVYRDSAGAGVSFDIAHVDDNGNRTSLSVVTSTVTTGWHTLSASALAHTVVNETYFIAFSLASDGTNANSARLLWVQAN